MTAVGAGILAVLLISSVLVSAVKSSEIREVQRTNTLSLTNSERTLDLIEDCTTPGGECYQRSQERTASVVGDIGRLSAYAAACADKKGVQGRGEIYNCVLRLLSQDSRRD